MKAISASKIGISNLRYGESKVVLDQFTGGVINHNHQWNQWHDWWWRERPPQTKNY
jgi:hypothetical protein